MKIDYNVYKNGASFCITMSYDDGRYFDRRLIHIFNKYGIRGTFHLNSDKLEEKYNPDSEGYVSREELCSLYENHEISMHGAEHCHPLSVPLRTLVRDMERDKKALEKYSGKIMRGMSYPFGAYNEQTLSAMRALGVEYSRTTKATFRFNPPDDFLLWHPTAHFREVSDSNEIVDHFFNDYAWAHKILYIWGHSYELGNSEKEWIKMERFCARVGGRKDTWYATNIEIKDYITAQRGLVFSYDCDMVYNPSAVDVWIRADGEVFKIGAGQTVKLEKAE